MGRTTKEIAFWPPFCPNSDCSQAAAPRPEAFLRHGHYTTRVQARRIPRFLCRSCRRTMSSQTFHVSYRLRRPDLEGAILKEIARGASLRRVAESLGVNRKTVSRRLRRARWQAPQTSQVAETEGPASGRKRVRTLDLQDQIAKRRDDL